MKYSYAFPPKTSPYKDWLKLDEDWCFFIGNKSIWIPANYWWDGASIPRIFWSVIGSPFEPDLQAASLAHDWLYLTHVTERSVADDILFTFCRLTGMGAIRARIIWGAVRSFGYFAWPNKQEDIQELQKIKNDVMLRPDFAKFDLHGDF